MNATQRTDLLAALAVLPPGRDEERLQRGISLCLQGCGIEYWPEHALDRDTRRHRIDFYLGDGIGIEVKTQGSDLSINRQIYRYADFLNEIILVTSAPLGIASGTIRNSRNETTALTVIELWRNPTTR